MWTIGPALASGSIGAAWSAANQHSSACGLRFGIASRSVNIMRTAQALDAAGLQAALRLPYQGQLSLDPKNRIATSFMAESHGGGRLENVAGFAATRALTAGLPGAVPPASTATALPRDNPTEQLEAVIGDDDRIMIGDTTLSPWRCICHLIIKRQNGSLGFGTGWFAGPRLVVTAGHCVLDHRPGAGWAETITVIPGRNGNYLPFRPGDVTNVFIDPRWTRDKNEGYDIGLLIMPDASLGSVVSWFGFGTLTDDSFNKPLLVNCSGYPQEKYKPFGTQWYSGGRINHFDKSFLYYAVDTEIGQSDSPVFFYGHNNERIVLGTHTKGTGYNRACRITDEIYDWLMKFRE